jgi:hypothetical protein
VSTGELSALERYLAALTVTAEEVSRSQAWRARRPRGRSPRGVPDPDLRGDRSREILYKLGRRHRPKRSDELIGSYLAGLSSKGYIDQGAYWVLYEAFQIERYGDRCEPDQDGVFGERGDEWTRHMKGRSMRMTG